MCDMQLNIKNQWLEGKTLFYVDDFGAVGDGVNDDAIAIRSCCEEAAKLKKPAAVVFTKGKTYYANSLNDKYPWTSPWSQKTVLYFEDSADITVEGNGSRLELGHSTGGIFTLRCKNFVFHNIEIDHKIPTFVAGVVESFDEIEKCLHIKTEISMDENLIDGEFHREGVYFALANCRDVISRKFLTITGIVSKGDCRYKIIPFDFDKAVDLVNYYGIDVPWMWPAGVAGHGNGLVCGIVGCGEMTFRDMEFQSGDSFMFHIQDNYGDISFINANVQPNPKYGTNYVTSGRDIFHCVDNRGAFLWENCKIWWAGDDFMNICDTTSFVDSVEGNGIKLRSMEFKHLVNYHVGDTLEVYDHITGKYYGTATVVENKEDTNYLDVPFKGIENNPNIRINCPNLAAPGSKIKNCHIVGTGRLKGEIEVTDTYFDVLVLWLMHECDYEGPIPKKMVFRNCIFDNGDIEIAAYDRIVPNSAFDEIGRLIDISFYDCSFNGINFVEKNSAQGNYYNCKYKNCIHTSECRFEK